MALPGVSCMGVGTHDTITLWIEDVAADAESELVSLPPSSTVALRVDESADGTTLAVLLAFVWYQPPRTIEEVLVSKCVAVAQTVPEQSVSSTSFESHRLFWNRRVDVCTDGAEGLVGKNAGARSQIQAMAPSDARKRGFFTATGSLKKSTCVMVAMRAELSPLFMEDHFHWKIDKLVVKT